MDRYSNLEYQKNFYDQEIIYRILEDKIVNEYDITDFILKSTTVDLLNFSELLRNKYNKLKIITYSRKIFINLINLCKDTCSYCTYKKEPTSKEATMLNPSQIISMSEAGQRLRCTEALIVTGERPELKYQEARKWLKDLGYRTLVDLIASVSEMILKKTTLLPHTNAGSLTKKELSMLKSTNISVGMMLENSSEDLVKMGQAHEKAPSKNPKMRIKSLVSAGELKMPITTGLLIGIGEKFNDVIESLHTIKNINEKYGNIQEVIIQNFAPKKGTAMEKGNPPSDDYFMKCIAVSRILLKDINIQAPPNLSPQIYSKYIDAGINDWGGISPLTPDFVNPEFPWPKIEDVKKITKSKGFNLRARLPLYPQYITDKQKYNQFVHENIKNHIETLIDKNGLVKEDYVQ